MSTSEVVSLIQKDSLEMNNADREAVRLVVNETIEDMIVVTHSTDTITNTDKVLSDIPDKAIVLAGTLSPATIYNLRRYVQYR
jgi:L-asparaginase